MFPWLFVWAPQIHMPLSGAVAQRIEPDWFFDAIRPAAGNARVEKKAFEVASYGRQLGLITDLLLDVAAREAPTSEEGRRALGELERIREEIGRVKADDSEAQVRELEADIARLRRRPDFAALRARLERALADDDG